MGKLEELKKLQEVMTIKDKVEIIVNTGKFQLEIFKNLMEIQELIF